MKVWKKRISQGRLQSNKLHMRSIRSSPERPLNHDSTISFLIISQDYLPPTRPSEYVKRWSLSEHIDKYMCISTHLSPVNKRTRAKWTLGLIRPHGEQTTTTKRESCMSKVYCITRSSTARESWTSQKQLSGSAALKRTKLHTKLFCYLFVYFYKIAH